MHRPLLRCLLLWPLACALPLAAQTPAPGSSVYRCGSSYSQTPCPGGQAIEDKLSVLHGSTTAAPGQATVYLCQGQGGGQFWSSTHCGQQKALIERMETVPASLPWAQQVQQAQRQWDQARRLEQPDVPQRRAPSDHHRASEARNRAAAERQAQQRERQDTRQNAATCAALRARIARLDSQGRAGSLHADLDQIRSERREARSEYRRNGC